MAYLKQKEQEYNLEPVHYCKQCLSLRILNVTGIEGLDYCDKCGSTDIGSASIEEWLKLFKEKYGYDYLEDKF